MTEPPLIAHVIYRLDYGGLENGLVNLINRMPPERFRHAIISLTDHSDFAQRLQHPVPIIDLHKQEGHDLGLYKRLWRSFRDLQPAIVHTRNLATVEAQFPALLAGVHQRVHGEHGWNSANPASQTGSPIWIRKAMRPLIQRFIALSGEIEQFLQDNIGVADTRITRICNGVDTDRFSPGPASAELLSELPFDHAGRTIIGTIGRMSPVKDQTLLVEAVIALIEQQPALRDRIGLVLVGAGPLQEQCRSLLQEAGLLDIAWLPGSRDDTPDLFRLFDIFVLPSRAEGISNTILEAMATGRAIIATNVGGNGELVEPEKNGLLVPFGDVQSLASALLRVITDQTLRASFASDSRKRALSLYSLDAMVSAYIGVYEQLGAK